MPDLTQPETTDVVVDDDGAEEPDAPPAHLGETIDDLLEQEAETDDQAPGADAAAAGGPAS